MKIVESNQDTIGRISVSGRVGEPLTFVFDELRNQVTGDGDYGWKAEIKIGGRRWQPIFLSPLRIGKVGVGIDNATYAGRITGGIIFFEKDRDAAMEMLRAAVRKLLSDEIDKLNVSISSI